MKCDLDKQHNLEEKDCSSTTFLKKEAPSHYLDQLKETIECDRRINALISLYSELQKRVESIEIKVAKLSQ